ncbi:hypothetical protein [Archangium sp.]|uniref:hypothetical protein n=1 Tax=Archangium sp. TaxID=1872627 RepID=UPI002D760614|nr:hypothetical protein [Archangium sp.]HYO55466.1 hypothetical protein [Archangium sp.]
MTARWFRLLFFVAAVSGCTAPVPESQQSLETLQQANVSWCDSNGGCWIEIGYVDYLGSIGMDQCNSAQLSLAIQHNSSNPGTVVGSCEAYYNDDGSVGISYYSSIDEYSSSSPVPEGCDDSGCWQPLGSHQESYPQAGSCDSAQQARAQDHCRTMFGTFTAVTNCIAYTDGFIVYKWNTSSTELGGGGANYPAECYHSNNGLGCVGRYSYGANDCAWQCQQQCGNEATFMVVFEPSRCVTQSQPMYCYCSR